MNNETGWLQISTEGFASDGLIDARTANRRAMMSHEKCKELAEHYGCDMKYSASGDSCLAALYPRKGHEFRYKCNDVPLGAAAPLWYGPDEPNWGWVFTQINVLVRSMAPSDAEAQ